jgi:hypothetical protein
MEVASHQCAECFDIQSTFEGRQWDSLPQPVLEAHTAFALFDPAAYVYFLPAYLLYSITYPGSDVADLLMINIAPSSQVREYGFNEGQRLAILAVAEYVAEQTGDYILEIRDLRRYWSAPPSNPALQRT